jgi:hypothetical protein
MLLSREGPFSVTCYRMVGEGPTSAATSVLPTRNGIPICSEQLARLDCPGRWWLVIGRTPHMMNWAELRVMQGDVSRTSQAMVTDMHGIASASGWQTVGPFSMENVKWPDREL